MISGSNKVDQICDVLGGYEDDALTSSVTNNPNSPITLILRQPSLDECDIKSELIILDKDYKIMKIFSDIQIPQQPDYFTTQEGGKITGIIPDRRMSTLRAYINQDSDWYLHDSEKDKWHLGMFVLRSNISNNMWVMEHSLDSNEMRPNYI